MKRLLDVIVALGALLILSVPMLLVALLIRLTSPGPAIYWSRRIGRDNRIFLMPKFRTMLVNTPQMATHLLTNSKWWITPIGQLLRQCSLDELPQLWSVLRGEMSLIGPRPALFNQDDLIAQRTSLRVHQIVPGLTGWAQVNGRDELTISQKVALDAYYMDQQSMRFDLWILLLTAVKVIRGDGIRQTDEISLQDRDHRTGNRDAA